MSIVYVIDEKAFTKPTDAVELQRRYELRDGSKVEIEEFVLDGPLEELIWGGEAVWEPDTKKIVGFSRGYFWLHELGMIRLPSGYVVYKSREGEEGKFLQEFAAEFKKLYGKMSEAEFAKQV